MGQALAVVAVIGATLTATVLAFFLIRDAGDVTGWMLRRLVAEDQRELVAAAGRRAGEALRGYMRGVVVIGTVDAVLVGVALYAVGIPLAAPLAVLTFLGGFPVVGATVAGLLATLVAVATNGITTGSVVLGIVILVQQVDGNVLQPAVMRRAVHLHPIVVLAALTAGGIVAGIVGAFMAVPIAAVIAAIGNEVIERRGGQTA